MTEIKKSLDGMLAAEQQLTSIARASSALEKVSAAFAADKRKWDGIAAQLKFDPLSVSAQVARQLAPSEEVTRWANETSARAKALQGIDTSNFKSRLDLARLDTFGSAIREAARCFQNPPATRVLQDACAAVTENEKRTKAMLSGSLGEITKFNQWASVIGKLEPIGIEKLAKSTSLSLAADILRGTVGHNLSELVGSDQKRMSAILGLSATLDPSLITTQQKLSVFAGISEFTAPGDVLRMRAYGELFGKWQTRPDLPDRFWRDKKVREDMYREADVDDGLIQATPETALEVVIKSGLIAGLRSEAAAVSMITVGSLSMEITTRNIGGDAYAALRHFELELRDYVNRKLQTQFGPNWFTSRASNLVGKAKQNRTTAMRKGEGYADLIHFIDLGDLANIVLNKNNWDEVFGDVFVNKQAFDFDMQRLIAMRNPTMHVRDIDSVRLVELICVIQRLCDQMKDDGAWTAFTDLDR